MTSTDTTAATDLPQAPAARTVPALRLTYTHDAMIDLILQEPTVSPGELAQVFGYTPSWVSRILSADSFQARLAQRRGALTDPIVAQNLNNRLRAVASRGLDVISEQLDKEPSAAFALRALELATAGLGQA